DVLAGVVGATAGVILAAALHSETTPTPLPPAALPPVVATQPAPTPDPPPAEPSQSTPTLMQAADATITRRTTALARELSTMWPRNPDDLVRVHADASRAAPRSRSVTLPLAIAHAETNGQILDDSEAGAAGPAAATPLPCRPGPSHPEDV